MHPKVVLLDLENNFPTAKLLCEIVTHYSSLYLFNCAGTFEFSLEDLTELAGWIASGQIIILDTPESPQKEYEYAGIVGQLMALLEPETEVELISAMDSSEMLQQMLQASDIKCSLIQIKPDEVSIPAEHVKNYLPSLEAIRNKPALQLVKKYCDALGKMSGKPNTLETLKNSVANILHVMPVKAQHVVGMLINLKIVKRYDEQISFRKKVLKQWLQLNLAEQDPLENPRLDQVMSRIKVDDAPVEALQSPIQAAQHDLF